MIGTEPYRVVTLDRLLKRLYANKTELLMVLDRPETPLHTNGSENDIRCYVTRRKVSAGTRSDAGRDCRDAFLGLAKTWDKLGIAMWDYLGSRLKVAGHRLIRPLDQYGGGRFCPCMTGDGRIWCTPQLTPQCARQPRPG